MRVLSLHLTSCFGLAAGLAAGPALAVELRFIGMRSLPHGQEFSGTIVGGLSGLDYDAARDRWLAVSDDKSEHGPARYYEVKLDYDVRELRGVEITGMTVLRQPDGSDYPDKPHFLASRRGDVPDCEALRLDPRDGSIWYASEGDRGLGLQPFVRHAARDGKFVDALALPSMFAFSRDREIGPRHNLVIEGLAFARDGASLWLALEAPLFQDGAPPTATSGALARFTCCTRNGKILAQFAYPVEPLPAAPLPGKLADNGVSEILAEPDGTLLALERSGWQDASDGWHFFARLFEVDFSGATDTTHLTALTGAHLTPATKRLVFDFAAAGQPHLDNLEGLAWGRGLPNGHATLVAVSDDNFSATEETQIWVFEVLPPAKNPPPRSP